VVWPERTKYLSSFSETVCYTSAFQKAINLETCCSSVEMPGLNQYNIMINVYKITTTNLMAESDLCMVSG